MSDKDTDDELSLAADDSNIDMNLGGDSAMASAQTGEQEAQLDAEEAPAAAEEEAAAESEEEEEIAAAPVMATKKRVRHGKAPNNVYTVLTFVAFVALTTAVVVMWIENLRLSEGDRPSTANAMVAPFHVMKK